MGMIEGISRKGAKAQRMGLGILRNGWGLWLEGRRVR